MSDIKEEPKEHPDIPIEDPPAAIPKRRLIKNYIGMLIIASLNNLPYWVAVANAQSIVHHFGKDGWLGAVTWCAVFLGMAGTTTNTFLTSRNVSYNLRSVANGIFMTGGLVATAFAPNIYIALAGIAFVGLSSDFGEGVMLGYFASKDNGDSMMGAWGVGTGISGILGSGYSFLCQFFSVPYKLSFLVLAPAGIVYPTVFILMLDAKLPNRQTHNHHRITDSNSQEPISALTMNEEEDEEEGPKKNPCFCSCYIWKKTFYYFINNAAVFFFQYVSISGFVDCSMTAEQKEKTPYVYGLLTLIYEVGNFFGRASLKWIKIPWLWLLTLIQGALWLVGLFDVVFTFNPLWGKIVLMILVGVNSGLSYVNVFNQVMNHKGSNRKEREIMTNLTSIGIAGDILLSSAFTLLMQNTFFKGQCLEK